MSTRTLASKIAKLAPSGWSIDGALSILKLIQEAQDELLDFEGSETIFTDPATGTAPFLQTVAGVKSYTVTEDTLSCPLELQGRDIRVKKILGVFSNRAVGFYNPNHLYKNYTGGASYVVPAAGRECTEGVDAQISLQKDPGESAETFVIVFTWEAPRLLSVNTPIMVPAEYEAGIEDYVLGKISEYAHGRPNERTAKFFSYWKPRYQDRASANASNEDNSFQPRIC